MAGTDINRSGELEVFVRVIETGGFSAAARSLELSPSAVSKLVSRLEQRLGTRLLQRSTRQLQLTPEGCAFYERGLRVLADLDEAERCASAHAEPRGRLRVNANVPFGHHFLLPLLPGFLAAHPQVGVDVVLTDEVIDLLEQRTDVAVRAGPLKSSSLVARRLGATRMMIVAAPAYLARHGMPQSADALQAHNRLDIAHPRAQSGWPLVVDGERQVVQTGAVRVPAMARRCAGWCWGAWDWRAWRRSRCRLMLRRGACCRCWSGPIRAIWKRCTRCFRGRAGTCRCGCVRCWIT